MMVEFFTVLIGYLLTVYYEAPSWKLATTVTVLTKDIVSVDAPKEMLTNVPFPTQGYSFLVKFRFVDHFCALEGWTNSFNIYFGCSSICLCIILFWL